MLLMSLLNDEHLIYNDSINMLKLILTRQVSFLLTFHVQKFQGKDYQAMCSLIREKYPIYNEAIQLSKDIKLLDEHGKLIGRYDPAEARRKAITMKKDIVLMSQHSNPAICKLYNFRESILQKFYDEIVVKQNQQLIRKATSSKQLKLSLSLNENELQIKGKQLIELAKKNLNVRAFIICKQSQTDEALSKLENLKSMIQNKCIIQRDVMMQNEDDEASETKEGENKRTFAMVAKSRQNQFIQLLSESNQKQPELAIQAFLKRYYKQEDVEMKDLKATAVLELDKFHPFEEAEEPKSKAKAASLNSADVKETVKNEKTIRKQHEEMINEMSYANREAKARILNERLRRILGFN